MAFPFEHAYTSVVLGRAREIFRTQKLTWTEENGFIGGQVQGSARLPYRVTVTITGGKRAWQGTCTCPVMLQCKHAAALLYQYCTDRERDPIGDLLQQLDATVRQPLAPQSWEFDLTSLPRSTGEGAVSTPWKAAKPQTDSAAPTFRLVFFLDNAPAQFGPARLVLKPGLQAILKDGSFGRLEKFSASKRIEPPPPAAEAVFHHLKLHGEEAEAALFLPKLASLPPGLLFLDPKHALAPHKPQPLSLQTLTGLSWRIVPGGLTSNHSQPKLDNLKLKTSGQLLGPDGAAWSFASTKELNLFVAGTQVLVVTEEPRLWLAHDWPDGALALLGRLARFADLPLAEALAWAERRDLAPLHFDLPWRKVRLQAPIPAPTLHLADGFRGTCEAKLRFAYPELPPPDTALTDEFVLAIPHQAEEARRLAEARHLLSAHFDLTQSSDRTLAVKGTSASLLQLTARDFLEAGWTIEAPQGKIAAAKSSVRLNWTTGLDWLDLEARWDDDTPLPDLDSEAVRTGFVRHGKTLVLLRAEDQAKLQAFLELGSLEQGKIRLSRLDFTLLERAHHLTPKNQPPALRASLETGRQLRDLAALPAVPLPSSLQAELRAYQRTGYYWLHFLHSQNLGGCLADDMGLGKTLQTLTYLLSRHEAGTLGPALLVAPVSTLLNWYKEIQRFTPALPAVVHHGTARRTADLPHSGLILTSYQTLLSDLEIFAPRAWSVLVLDEAQAIKNPGSLSFRAVRSLNARQRLSLTGTPLENSPLDLWAQMDFLNPGLLGGHRTFLSRFDFKSADPEKARLLRDIIRPFVLRRTKEAVATDLPAKEEIIVWCEMEPRQKAFYNQLKAGLRQKLEDAFRQQGKAKSSALFFEAMLRLRQAALFPALADPKGTGLPSCKFQALQDLLPDLAAEGHKALIFSQFTGALGHIRTWLDSEKYGYTYLDGSTKNRQALIDRFQDQPDLSFFLLSLKAGGVGINLTAADYVLLFDPWWNPAIERQAVDRAHRIGQTRGVFVYKFVVKDSIEEKVLELQARKRELIDQLIAEGSGFLAALSEEQALELLG